MRDGFEMAEKVLGFKEDFIHSLVNKHSCIIHRVDFVPVVSVEFLEKYCQNKYSNTCSCNKCKAVMNLVSAASVCVIMVFLLTSTWRKAGYVS